MQIHRVYFQQLAGIGTLGSTEVDTLRVLLLLIISDHIHLPTHNEICQAYIVYSPNQLHPGVCIIGWWIFLPYIPQFAQVKPILGLCLLAMGVLVLQLVPEIELENSVEPRDSHDTERNSMRPKFCQLPRICTNPLPKVLHAWNWPLTLQGSRLKWTSIQASSFSRFSRYYY